MNLEFDILYQAESSEDVFAKEEEFIKIYNSKENGYNLADGGLHNKGYQQSLHAKEVASEIHSKKVGELNSFYGKKHSDETKRKISESKKGKKGIPLTDHQKQTLYENHPRRKEVYCYGILYSSLSKAEEAIKINRKKISKMAQDDKNKDFTFKN